MCGWVRISFIICNLLLIIVSLLYPLLPTYRKLRRIRRLGKNGNTNQAIEEMKRLLEEVNQ